VGLELVIRGATVVTPGHRETADIGIAEGRIAELGGTMAGTQELDAGGLLAIPGGVDAHTHLVHQGLGGRLGFPDLGGRLLVRLEGRDHRRHHDDR
jgi:dihydroorotase-like cyclic amidohydrolase